MIVVIEERFFNVKIGDFSHKFTIKRGHSEGLYPIIINNIELKSTVYGDVHVCSVVFGCPTL